MNPNLFMYNCKHLPDDTFDERQQYKLSNEIERNKDCTSQQRISKLENIIIDILTPVSIEGDLKENQQGILE